jgi:transcriptional regulator with XRE-family HTH domain
VKLSYRAANICSQMHGRSDFDNAMRLIEAGVSDADVAARTGISRRTVNRWRHQRRAPGSLRRRAPAATRWQPPNPATYAYLFGLYLGDGYIASSSRSPFLQVSLDQRYPAVIAECAAAVAATFPRSAVHVYPRSSSGCTVVQASTPMLTLAFPQHGPGRKHERTIGLAGWQRRITTAHVRPFLRGLIHSDGCRTVNRFRTKLPSGRVADYAYPRYFFSNASADIRRIFCRHCELLGIRWTQSNARNISVSHRDSVAVLDSFVGPKS